MGSWLCVLILIQFISLHFIPIRSVLSLHFTPVHLKPPILLSLFCSSPFQSALTHSSPQLPFHPQRPRPLLSACLSWTPSPDPSLVHTPLLLTHLDDEKQLICFLPAFRPLQFHLFEEAVKKLCPSSASQFPGGTGTSRALCGQVLGSHEDGGAAADTGLLGAVAGPLPMETRRSSHEDLGPL